MAVGGLGFAANCELRTANCELRTANCELRTENCPPKFIIR
jgi:hypothetical protein